MPRSQGDAYPLIGFYGGLEMLPVSAKSYWSEQYFRDANHLEANLKQGATLSNWWMPPLPYDRERDRVALELYARYNRTEDGIRVLRHRRVYVFRGARVTLIDRCIPLVTAAYGTRVARPARTTTLPPDGDGSSWPGR